jgi:protein required for attachment to host cells
MKPTRTWILIANGAQAHILLNDGPGHGVKALNEFKFHSANLSNQEINADRPGRSFDSTGEARHAMEPATDPRRHEAREFAAMLVDVLSKQHENKAYDKLILVASPAALGDLRNKLPQTLKAIITGEIAKDLTHVPVHEIAPYLTDVLAV